MRESDFARQVCRLLRDNGVFVQRIESHTTGRGIPDCYYATRDESGWLEFKVVHESYNGCSDQVHWRAGQQAWLCLHYLYSPHTYTIVHYEDCICAIPASKHYMKGDMLEQVYRSKHLVEVLKQL